LENISAEVYKVAQSILALRSLNEDLVGF